MRFFVRNRQVEVELQPILISILILGWALYYYFSTVNKPSGGAESVRFIKPLTITLVICFFFVVLSAVKIDPEKEGAERAKDAMAREDLGFLDHRRLFFAASIVAYAAGLTFFGYLIPSILFIFIICYYLGVRTLWILIGLPVGLSSLLSVVFKILMKVPIPIWPSW